MHRGGRERSPPLCATPTQRPRTDTHDTTVDASVKVSGKSDDTEKSGKSAKYEGTYDDQQIAIALTEKRDVDVEFLLVRFVQRHTEFAITRQAQKDEDAGID